MVNFFEPIKAAAAGATDNVTLALDDYTLRPAMVDALETLEGEMGVILAALATVREVMSCGNVHALYKEAKTAVCCDWAYAANFLWVSRVATRRRHPPRRRRRDRRGTSASTRRCGGRTRRCRARRWGRTL